MNKSKILWHRCILMISLLIFFPLTFIAVADAAVQYHAVIVGISDYKGFEDDLDYCDNDAKAVYKKLLESNNWSKSNMKLILNSSATKTNIRKAVQRMASSADADDVCLFYFSGHGDFVADTAPFDEIDGFDELLCPYRINSNQILDDELYNWLNALPTNKIIVWLDTCFSGGNIKAVGARVKTISNNPGRIFKKDGFIADLLKKAKDVNNLSKPYCITACDDDERSYEMDNIEHGVFTYYLLEALDLKADTNNNEWVSGEEAFDYLAPKVTSYEPSQHPQEYDNYPGQSDVWSQTMAELSNGQRIEVNLSQGQKKYFKVNVPSGVAQVDFSLTRLSRDLDLYVRYGEKPTETNYDCGPYNEGRSDETCTFDFPAEGFWYIMISGYNAGRGFLNVLYSD